MAESEPLLGGETDSGDVYIRRGGFTGETCYRRGQASCRIHIVVLTCSGVGHGDKEYDHLFC